MSDTTISIEAVIDRIIEITERNLQMQSEFLKAVYDLKSRFDTTDRDHKEMSDDLRQVLEHSTDMLNRMRQASNEKIIELLEDSKESQSLFKHKSETAIIELKQLLESIKGIKPSCEQYHKDVSKVDVALTDMGKDVKKVSESFDLIKKILGAIAIMVIGVQIVFGLWTGLKRTFERDEIRREMKHAVESVQQAVPGRK